MRKNIFLSMLEITKLMHQLAIEHNWDQVAEKEHKRQDLINELRTMLSEDCQETQEIIIEIIKEMNVINTEINNMAIEENKDYKKAIMDLRKGEKAKNLYLD
ncbi:MAG: hypothetical protein ACJA2B_001994 [Candidatus Endobugula sp.]|jgi:hypothetical protein